MWDTNSNPKCPTFQDNFEQGVSGCSKVFQGVATHSRTKPKCPETNQGQSGPTRIDKDQPGLEKLKLGN